MGNMAQANSIATSLYSTWNVPTWLSGTVTALLIAMVIIGGVKRIGSITQYLIPVLSTGYIVGALLVIFSSADRLPQVFRSIFLQAFGVDSVTGGVTGGLLTAINVGFRRGVFSNEVGLGSSSMLHSSAESQNAHTMGLWGMFEVFVDTMVCCTLTALAILVTDIPHALDSTNLVIESFKHGLGEYSVVFITVAIALFAFATLVGWSVCGETCSKYLFGASGVTVYRVFFVGCIVLGSVLNGGAVWTISDIFNGLMAIPNLIGIMLLSVKLDFKKAIGNAHDMSIPKE
jgi:AGCS family alanine or glycine:cation symporter